jgi:hypothetical protein
MGHDFKEGQILWCGNDLYPGGLIHSGHVIRKIQHDNLIAEMGLEENYITLDTMVSESRPWLHFGTTKDQVVKKVSESRHAEKVRDADRLTLEEVEYELSFWTQHLRRRSGHRQ